MGECPHYDGKRYCGIVAAVVCEPGLAAETRPPDAVQVFCAYMRRQRLGQKLVGMELWEQCWRYQRAAREVAEEELAALECRDLSVIQHQAAEWVREQFPHMSEDELGLAHALGVAEEYFELGQAIQPLVRAALKRKNQIRRESYDVSAVADAVGDVMVFLGQLAHSFGLDLGDVVKRTWEQVRGRDWNAYSDAGQEGPSE
jgi:NTP pyrophosphatase (non-canonical NTP hydrolase)